MQLPRERGHAAGFDALEQPRPGQDLVDVASELTDEPLVDVITVQVLESVPLWPAVGQQASNASPRNQVHVKYRRVSDIWIPLSKAGRARIVIPKVSGAAMHMSHLPLCRPMSPRDLEIP